VRFPRAESFAIIWRFVSPAAFSFAAVVLRTEFCELLKIRFFLPPVPGGVKIILAAACLSEEQFPPPGGSTRQGTAARSRSYRLQSENNDCAHGGYPMSRRDIFVLAMIPTTLFLLVLFATPVASQDGQVAPQRLEAIQTRLRHAKTFFDKMPEARRQVLSSAGQNLIHLASVWEKQGARPRETLNRPAQLRNASTHPAAPGGLIPVSDPSNDFAFSVLTGFTQSETSTAWCGSHVVVGFNDSGSIPESVFFGPGGVSLSGVALSTDHGHSYLDLGFVNPGSNPASLLAGDPVLGCGEASTFHYAQIFLTADSMGNPLADIAVSTSTDGGATWADPVAAASKDGFTHFLDKDWMAVDPTKTSRLYVTYTDFDSSGVCGPSALRVAIELVSSPDGGATWGAPVVIDELCSPFSAPGLFDQGSQVAVGPGGEVYVAWEFFQADFFTREIRIRKSTDHGMSFAAALVKASDVTPVGDGSLLQGGFRSAFDFPSLAVDRSGTATNGNVYIAWHDGRNVQVPDFESGNGVYGYADVLVTKSTDGGATWSSAVRVNTKPEPLRSGRGTDQFQPGIAVDNTGKVGACWYDRRLDPLNYQIDRFCGVSTDAGATWTNKRQSSPSWSPIHATDGFINPFYMGDYDSLASNSTQSSPGFLGAFQMMNTRGGLSGNAVPVPNSDVFATSVE
jgi:hypothetical protein